MNPARTEKARRTPLHVYVEDTTSLTLTDGEHAGLHIGEAISLMARGDLTRLERLRVLRNLVHDMDDLLGDAIIADRRAVLIADFEASSPAEYWAIDTAEGAVG